MHQSDWRIPWRAKRLAIYARGRSRHARIYVRDRLGAEQLHVVVVALRCICLISCVCYCTSRTCLVHRLSCHVCSLRDSGRIGQHNYILNRHFMKYLARVISIEQNMPMLCLRKLESYSNAHALQFLSLCIFAGSRKMLILFLQCMDLAVP